MLLPASMQAISNPFRLCAATAIVLVMAGCASTTHKAPVEDRGRVGTGLSPTRLPPGTENAGKPGYYTVKPGDTLIRIALETGQNWRDLVAWNGLDNPNLIEVGQVLRVQPTEAAAAAATTTVATPVTAAKPITTARIESRSLDGMTPATPGSGAASASAGVKPGVVASGAATSPAPVVAPAVPATPVAEVKDADEPAWTWPSTGPVVGNFEEGKRKGMVFSGKAGDPVLAAADGRVVYAGSGLRGYGNLVIVKHNASYLTAYAHNQTLLVKEDQAVRKGQKIAEMGNTDADRVQLHFEVRKQGKPIDPAKSLPGR